MYRFKLRDPIAVVSGSGHLRDMWSPHKEPQGTLHSGRDVLLVPDFEELENEEG